MKKFILFVFLLVAVNCYGYNCSYEWEHSPDYWLCDVNGQYYETWEACNSYCFVAEDSGNNGGNGVQIDDTLLNFLYGLSGIVSAGLIWFSWNNANN